MRIAHISDLHIRNFKYRREYNEAFADLYRQLRELSPDLVINTGDTVHSKLAVSPELFDDIANHMLAVTDIAPYWLILGNHDLNLKNKGRTDAISPIVRALQGRTRNELKLLSEGNYRLFPGQFNFWHYDIRGHKDFAETSLIDDLDVNIGLFHGSISGCQTDMGFVMEDGEAEVSRFDQMDYVLMGDIHKRQSFRDGRMQYPGSLIQQNYGEELEKGFLMWDIRSKDDFDVTFHSVRAPGRFYTIQVPPSFDLTGIDVPPESRIRVRLEGEISPSRRIQLEKALVERFQPLEVITPDPSADRDRLEELSLDRLVGDREVMLVEHLRENGLSEEKIPQVVALWKKMSAEWDDSAARGTSWSLKSIAWDNMMNYGEGNSIDVGRLNGLVGIFGPNAIGKSTIFDIILESLFDKVSKEVPRNIDLINDNKDVGLMTVEFESSGHAYFIERQIERISYGQRKLAEVKQWGKTSLEFAMDGEALTGVSRPETEREIRAIIGSFEDFVLTTMLSQNPVFGLPGGGDLINCKETDRRKILFRFLDLDIYEKVHQGCKDELKGTLGSLAKQPREEFVAQIEAFESWLATHTVDLAKLRAEAETLEASAAQMREKLGPNQADDIKKLEREQQRLLDDRVSNDLARSRANTSLKKWTEIHSQEESRLSTIISERPPTPTMGAKELEEAMADVSSKLATLNVDIKVNAAEISRGKLSLRVLEEVPCEGKFPSCRFISDAIKFRDSESGIAGSLMETTLRREVLSAKLAELQALSSVNVAHDLWEKRLNATTSAVAVSLANVERFSKELGDIEARRERLNELENDLNERLAAISFTSTADLRNELERTVKQLDSVRNRIEQALKAAAVVESKLLDTRLDLADIDSKRQTVEIYEHLADATSKNGLPYRILAKVLPLINHEIAKILSGVAKFSVFFDDDRENQSVSLYIRYGDYKSRPLGMGSGAEKFIASLAIRAALLSVSSLPKTDMLIIDEGFGKLDPEHLEALQRMFEYLKENFGKVFIVSHVDFMRDIVDHSIDISSEGGYAHVQV